MGTSGNNYANPKVLVSTGWISQHRGDPDIRVVEVDVDTKAYEQGHIPGALGWNWQTQLQDNIKRDLVNKSQFEKLLSESGISNNTTVVLYGDNNNWFAAYAFWLLKYYGHQDVRIMDGGRQKWIEEGREFTKDVPTHPKTNYQAKEPDKSIRAFLDEVSNKIEKPDVALVDVRSPQEFTGEILAPPGLNETCQRGGHIPGAKNIPWGQTVKEDGTFKSYQELKSLYEGIGVTPEKEIIAYCRIGERSSHTWFVLKYLLGYPNVKNYDGSWTEWGNLVAASIER